MIAHVHVQMYMNYNVQVVRKLQIHSSKSETVLSAVAHSLVPHDYTVTYMYIVTTGYVNYVQMMYKFNRKSLSNTHGSKHRSRRSKLFQNKLQYIRACMRTLRDKELGIDRHAQWGLYASV